MVLRGVRLPAAYEFSVRRDSDRLQSRYLQAGVLVAVALAARAVPAAAAAVALAAKVWREVTAAAVVYSRLWEVAATLAVAVAAGWLCYCCPCRSGSRKSSMSAKSSISKDRNTSTDHRLL